MILYPNFTVYESGHFDVIWASPLCTEYSTPKAVGVRDLEKKQIKVYEEPLKS